MKASGWNLNVLQSPACIHLCCTMLHAQSGVADRFIKDVKVAVKKVRIHNITYIHIKEKNIIIKFNIYFKTICFNFMFQLTDDPSIGETKNAALYGSSASVSDRGIIDRIVWAYLDSLYVTKATKMIPKQERQDANNGAKKQNGHLKQK